MPHSELPGAAPTAPSAGATAASAASTIKLSARDLPAFCPNPNMARWSGHPRVFIDVTTTGEGRCPYCGTHYLLDGPAPAGH
ncbi:MAG: zinc-finger domain-containing protein [Alphaproteobacteria bacterium]|jgi:hypothetical protein|nr:zinc-finger domain-containing protein [Alphaproteobacteria bacterium]